MKKIFALLMTAILLMTGTLVLAESQEGSILTGTVTDITEEAITFVNADEQLFQANLTDGTVIEGDLVVGALVIVQYDGIMTRSIPAQITAQSITVVVEEECALSGFVAEVTDEYFTFTTADEQLIQANIATPCDLVEGDLVLVTYNGQMTFSIPAQISAMDVQVIVEDQPEMTGTVTEITEEAITFTTPDGQTIQANLSEETVHEYLLPTEALQAGDFIHVTYNGQMTMSIPAQIAATVVRSYVQEGQVTAIGDTYFMLKTEVDEIQVNCTAEQLAQVTEGAQVTVYFSGAMTMSLPAQIGAELIVVAE